MRGALVRELLPRAGDENFLFITGDLGFDVLEPLREKMGSRFINGGIAEQNIVSVAAGAARAGMKVWVYSIGPFLFSRAAEQIRNDIGLNNTPVTLVANGAGLHYGVQGPSHFSADDLGFLTSVQNLETLTPAFEEDMRDVVSHSFESQTPTYIRLGRNSVSRPPDLNAGFSKVRKVLEGKKGVLLCFGSIVGDYLQEASEIRVSERPAVWVATTVPKSPADLDKALVAELSASLNNVIVEEHVKKGGFGMNFINVLHEAGLLKDLEIRCLALEDSVFSQYGSQAFLKKLSGLDAGTVLRQFGIGG